MCAITRPSLFFVFVHQKLLSAKSLSILSVGCSWRTVLKFDYILVFWGRLGGVELLLLPDTGARMIHSWEKVQILPVARLLARRSQTAGMLHESRFALEQKLNLSQRKHGRLTVKFKATFQAKPRVKLKRTCLFCFFRLLLQVQSEIWSACTL